MLRGHSAPIFFLFIADEENRIFSISTDKCIKVGTVHVQGCLQSAFVFIFLFKSKRKGTESYEVKNLLLAGSGGLLPCFIQQNSSLKVLGSNPCLVNFFLATYAFHLCSHWRGGQLCAQNKLVLVITPAENGINSGFTTDIQSYTCKPKTTKINCCGGFENCREVVTGK